MSAVRTRILLGDDADLARVKTTISGRADLDVVSARSAEDVVRAFSEGSPSPRAAILPATGSFDGITLCRQLKAARPDVAVILVLPADKASLRDSCVVAGADDVVFSPADAEDLTRALGDAGGFLFDKAPRAEVPLRVHLQAATGKVLEVEARQVSRTGMLVALPAGATPAASTLLRAVFTLYQDGSLTVWARTTPMTSPPNLVLRFVALTPDERKALDYFVGFYTKPAGAAASPFTAATDDPTRETADLRASSESLADLFATELGTLASVAGSLAQGKADVQTPAGFSGARLKANVARLTPPEAAAVRGTSPYSDLAGDLRASAAMKLKLLELAAQLKGGAPDLSKKVAEDTVLTLIAEAQTIHGRLESAVQGKVVAADTNAVRELNPVKTALVHACVELKNTLDRDVFGKAIAAGPAPSMAAPVRYDRVGAADKPPAPPADAPVPKPAGSSRRTKIALGIVLVAGAAGAVASNLGTFLHSPPPEVRLATEFTAGPLNVARTFAHGDGVVVFLVDDSWKHLSDAERTAALAQLASVAAARGGTRFRVMSPTGQELHAADVAPATPVSSP